jgi:hypothetical protein
MSTIIIATLLYVIVELLGVNTREESLTQTQQDMKRALDYIKADVSESVYVYADPSYISDQLAETAIEDADPVLAFWRIDPVDTSDLNGDCGTYGNQEEECEALKVRQFAHTLVVYFQEPNGNDDIWEGPRRIVRYELPKYRNVSNLTLRDGYIDPSQNDAEDDDGNNITYDNWAPDGDTRGTIAVLTDYVDSPTLDANDDPIAEDCPDGFADFADAHDNFYVCVSGGATQGQNRSLLLFLRGSTFDENQIVFGPSAEASRLPTLETEVFVRGVVEEQPDFGDG